MSEWKEYKLREISEIICGATPSTSIPEYWGNEIKWVTAKDISESNGYKIFDTERRITDLGFESSSTRMLPKNTTVLIARGATMGKSCMIGEEMTVNQTCYALIANIEFIDAYYLHYLIKSLINHFTNISHGAIFDTVIGSSLRNTTVKIPLISEQKVITSILSSLDDKIDLLHRQNKTLEALAETLFKQWFPPSQELRRTGVEEADESWEEKSLDEIAEYLNGLALQKFPSRGYDDLPVIKIREMKQGITESTDWCSRDIPHQYIIHDGDILFSWSGSLEVVIWHDGEGALNQHLFKVSSDKYPKWFYYLATKQHLPTFKSIAESKTTTMGHIQRENLKQVTIAIPPKGLFNQYDKTISPLIEKEIKNNYQIRTLTQLRDTLLPKLMSGEVRIKS